MPAVKRTLQLAIGITIIVLLINHIGINRIAETFSKFQSFFLVMLFVFLLVYLSLFCMAVGLYFFVKYCHPITFKEIYKDVVLTWAFTTFGPGRAGEFLLIYFFKQKEMPLGQASAVVVLDKIVSIIIMAGLALLGLVIIVPQAPVFQWTLLTVIGLFTATILLSSWGRRFIRTYVLKRFSSLFSGFGRTLNLLLYEHPGTIVTNVVFTLLKTAFTALIYVSLFAGFGVKVDLFRTVLIFCVFTIAQGIPVSMNGLGIREGIGLWLYGHLGVDAAVTLAVFFTYFVFRNVFSVLSIMVLAGNRWRAIYNDIKNIPVLLRTK